MSHQFYGAINRRDEDAFVGRLVSPCVVSSDTRSTVLSCAYSPLYEAGPSLEVRLRRGVAKAGEALEQVQHSLCGDCKLCGGVLNHDTRQAEQGSAAVHELTREVALTAAADADGPNDLALRGEAYYT